MLPNALETVVIDNLEQLVTDAVHEGKAIEFKREFYNLNAPEPGKTKQHEELLKDISSFANTLGGDLIFGIRAVKGAAKEVCGFPEADPDALKLRISQLAENWLEPRISMTIHHVPHSTPGNIVLVIRIQRSMLAPHRVIYQNVFGQFWARNSGGAVPMDTMDLRQAFTLSESIYDKIRSFRESRVRSILAGHTPVLLSNAAKMILHLIPQDSYVSKLQFPVTDLQQLQLPIISRSGLGSHRFNMDGLVKFQQHGNEPASGYVQMWRNGIIEAVCDGVTFHHPNDGDRTVPQFMTSELESLFLVFPSYIRSLKALGLSPPVWCFLTITGMKGVRIPGHFSRVMAPIDRDTLWLPEMEISNYDIPRSDTFLRPLVDMIWNAGGDASCPHYSAAGEYSVR